MWICSLIISLNVPLLPMDSLDVENFVVHQNLSRRNFQLIVELKQDRLVHMTSSLIITRLFVIYMTHLFLYWRRSSQWSIFFSLSFRLSFYLRETLSFSVLFVPRRHLHWRHNIAISLSLTRSLSFSRINLSFIVLFYIISSSFSYFASGRNNSISFSLSFFILELATSLFPLFSFLSQFAIVSSLLFTFIVDSSHFLPFSLHSSHTQQHFHSPPQPSLPPSLSLPIIGLLQFDSTLFSSILFILHSRITCHIPFVLFNSSFISFSNPTRVHYSIFLLSSSSQNEKVL